MNSADLDLDRTVEDPDRVLTPAARTAFAALVHRDPDGVEEFLAVQRTPMASGAPGHPAPDGLLDVPCGTLEQLWTQLDRLPETWHEEVALSLAAVADRLLTGPRRDPVRLRTAARLLEQDMRTVGAVTRIDVSDSLEVTIEQGGRRARGTVRSGVTTSLLALYTRADGVLDEDVALEEDAAGAVVELVLELLYDLGAALPTCPTHGGGMSHCGSTWFCERGALTLGALSAPEPCVPYPSPGAASSCG